MNSIEQAIETIRAGGMVIVVDDESRENEGDLVMAAERVTPQAITFMARQGCGLICLSLTSQQLDHLDIPLMVPHDASGDTFKTAFTISIEAANGVTTGISAADRARTILVASHPASKAEAISTPGHIFPLRARAGGVLERPGHTEASVDLARLAGLWPAGVICEIMDEDGTMMRLPRLKEFARLHDLPIITIEDLIATRKKHDATILYQTSALTPLTPSLSQSLPDVADSGAALSRGTRGQAFPRGVKAEALSREPIIERVARTRLPTKHGTWQLHVAPVDGREHLAFVMGSVDDGSPIIVRVHSECITGDVFGSKRCDCGPQLEQAMQQIAQEGRGIVLYLRQEGRGIGLVNKLRAYALQDLGLDTVEANEHLGFLADERSYQVAAEMLSALEVQRVRLLTNNPRKVTGLAEWGIDVVERIPIEIIWNPENRRYLQTKQHKLGHLFSVPNTNGHQSEKHHFEDKSLSRGTRERNNHQWENYLKVH